MGNEVVINSKSDRWHVHVPIKDSEGKVNWIYLFADPGANVGCVKAEVWSDFSSKTNFLRNLNRL